MPHRTKRRTLREFAAALGYVEGCTDNTCVWGRPGGLATNGGCVCVRKDPLELRRQLITMSAIAAALAKDHQGLLVAD